jgi:hypothetical protein
MVTIFNSKPNQEPEKTPEPLQERPPAMVKKKPKKSRSQPGPWVIFSPPITKLLKTYRRYFLDQQERADIATIHVDEIASKIALFYEKIRKIVDWKEEHLVRRGAMERILKRKMISEISGINIASDFNPAKIAEPLILELVRGGHFPNGKIPSGKIKKVQEILEKYAFILKNNPTNEASNLAPQIKRKINLYNWILEIAACEIEETLAPPVRQNALITCMVTLMAERIRLSPPDTLSDQDKMTQLYIAVHRTLFHLDSPIISYRLLKKRWPDWQNLSGLLLERVAKSIFSVIDKVEKDLSHPFASHFANLCEKYDTLYLLLSDILETFEARPKAIRKKLSEPKKVISLIKKAYRKRLKTLKRRLYRAAIYSTLSIFVAGGLSLFIFEVPLAKLVYGDWKPLAVVVDILLPTALMAVLVAMVKPPRESNLDVVIRESLKIIYPTREKDVYEIKLRKKKNIIISFLVGILYLLGTAASLGLVFWVFDLANVPVTSLYIDTLNVAMIVFAALVIKQRAKELTVEERVGFWDFFIDILSVPMAKLGQWLSNKWKEWNIVSVFFTALVDMPFSTFIGFIENWSSFIKEKKGEISH